MTTGTYLKPASCAALYLLSPAIMKYLSELGSLVTIRGCITPFTLIESANPIRSPGSIFILG